MPEKTAQARPLVILELKLGATCWRKMRSERRTRVLKERKILGVAVAGLILTLQLVKGLYI